LRPTGAPQARDVGLRPDAGLSVSLQEKQEAIVNMRFSWRGMTARPASDLKVRSSLVRRLVQAHDDPGKQRIGAWLRALDDEQLSNLGLTPEDIQALRL
jgi:uncharacterized protein YjiS (DUF1127 family)